MSMIILEDKDGNRRTILSGKKIDPPRRPGERIVGVERDGKDFRKTTQERKEQYGKFVLLANLFGMGIADFITFAAKAFGIEPCALCEMRKLILYRMGELGIRKALWMLLQTFKAQFGKGLGFSTTKKILIAARELLQGKGNGISAD